VAGLVVEEDVGAQKPESVSAKGRELVAASHAQGEPEATTGRPPQSLKRYGGISRLGYFLYSILICEVLMIGLSRQPDPAKVFWVDVLCIGATFCITAARLHNVGVSGWWSLLLLVPIVNILLGVRCSIFPEGYADHRQLDFAAKVILWLILGAVVILVGLLVVVRVLSRFHSQV
jgi:uncharacterized membrane protein YhaH (DUF805 family)